ncbi:MAG: hypothetical protein GY696_31290 [Gammaproteobacteria bacterium]|nr:hypothetical protein [Gammaproteobacteria bacterium]
MAPPKRNSNSRGGRNTSSRGRTPRTRAPARLRIEEVEDEIQGATWERRQNSPDHQVDRHSQVLYTVLKMCTHQMEVHESVQKQLAEMNKISKIRKESKPVSKPESVPLGKQYEFNSAHISSLEELKTEFGSNPGKAIERIDEEIQKFKIRNSKLLMADRFPGSLGILETLEELSDLKKDPVSRSFVADAIQMSSW